MSVIVLHFLYFFFISSFSATAGSSLSYLASRHVAANTDTLEKQKIISGTTEVSAPPHALCDRMDTELRHHVVVSHVVYQRDNET